MITIAHHRPFISRAGILLAAISCVAIAAIPCRARNAQEWQELKSQHFLVLHTGDQAFADKVSRHAEQYYQSLTTTLGFTRFKDFWLWEHRARILIYPNLETFRSASKSPPWAAGRASASLHEIAGSRDDGDQFLTTVLPHELAHLIVAEFIGSTHLPQWLSEGVAQWVQNGHGNNFHFQPGKKFIPLQTLFTVDIRSEHRLDHAGLYYAECASLVSFLITQYGSDNFGRLCRALREGKSTPDALATAYPEAAKSITALESAWLRSQNTSK